MIGLRCGPDFPFFGKSDRAKTQKANISENFAEEKCSQKIFQKISGYLRNLRGRLFSSEKCLEVSTLWVVYP